MTTVNSLVIDDQKRFYQQIIDYSVEPTILHLNHRIVYINESGAEFLGGKKELIIGTLILNIISEQTIPFIKKRIEKVMKENEPAPLIEQELKRLDGTTVEVLSSCHPVMYGDQVVIQTVFRDITNQKDVEKLNIQLVKKVNELSFPIVPILDDISVLPLIGVIDRERADRLLESVPLRIQGKDLKYLIIDFSGIYNFDTIIVEYLLKLDKVMKLLGVQLVSTGIRPKFAQASIDFNMDLRFIETASTVKHALHSLGVKAK